MTGLLTMVGLCQPSLDSSVWCLPFWSILSKACPKVMGLFSFLAEVLNSHTVKVYDAFKLGFTFSANLECLLCNI